ncbi:MAG: hypothetical protein ACYS47_15040 [Planctomycetota bacterium]|jgi:hypothetical protein
MKILLIAVTCLAVATAAVLGGVAWKTYALKATALEERDELLEQVKELEEDRDARGRAAVEFLGIPPHTEEGAEKGDPLSKGHVSLCMEFLVSQNRRLDQPLRAGFLDVKSLFEEFSRELGAATRKNDEYQLQLENRENRIDELESTIRRLEQEPDPFQRERDPVIRRLEDTIRSFERQVTDLRERIRDLSSDLERVCEEKRKEQLEFRSRLEDLTYEKDLHVRALHVGQPWLRNLLSSSLPKDRFGAARILDTAKWVEAEEIAELAKAMDAPRKGERAEAVRFFMDQRRHGAVYSALRAAFHDETLPPDRRLEILQRLLENGNRHYLRLAAKWVRGLPPKERETAAERFAHHEAGYCLPLWASLLDAEDDGRGSRALRNLKSRFPFPVGGEAEIPSWEQAFLEYGDDSLPRILHWVKTREKSKEVPVPPGPLRLSFRREYQWLLMKDVPVRARVLDSAWDELPLVLEPRDRPFETVLKESARAVGAGLAFRRGLYLVGSEAEIAAWDAEHPPWDASGIEGPPWRFELVLRLEDRKADFDFMDTHILDVAEAFQRKLDANLVVLGAAAEPASRDEMYVQLKVNGLNGREFLTLTSQLKELRYDFRWGVILWGRNWDLDALYDIPFLGSEHAAAKEWKEKRVTLDLPNATLRDAFHVLAEKHGVFFVYAPDLPNSALEKRMRLQVRDVTVAQALHLLLAPRGLTLEAPEKGTAPTVCLRK